MELNELRPPVGSTKDRKRVGRGQGCHGKTAGRGHKGQRSRAGFSIKTGFEGGQMPLNRRVPKRGFVNIFARKPAAVNLLTLERFSKVSEFTPEVFVELGIVKKANNGIKLLGKGEISRAVTVKVHKISKSAQEKIEKAGGKIEVIS
jgi:large subunit ribosomal protein L15